MALKGLYIDNVKCLFAPEDILDGGIEPYIEALTEYCDAWLEKNYSDNTVLRSDEDINVNNITAGGNVTILGDISAANFDPDTFTLYEAGDNITFTEGEGVTTINAADPPELIAGTNVTLTEDAANNQITIDAADTTYSPMTANEATAGSSSAARTISPAVLRGAISGSYIVESKSLSGVVNKNASKTITLDATKSGYTAIGVVGFNSSSASCNIYGCYISGSNNVVAKVFNPGVSADASITVTVAAYVLYRKD